MQVKMVLYVPHPPREKKNQWIHTNIQHYTNNLGSNPSDSSSSCHAMSLGVTYLPRSGEERAVSSALAALSFRFPLLCGRTTRIRPNTRSIYVYIYHLLYCSHPSSLCYYIHTTPQALPTKHGQHPSNLILITSSPPLLPPTDPKRTQCPKSCAKHCQHDETR